MDFTNIDPNKLIINENTPFINLSKRQIQDFLQLYYSGKVSVKELVKKFNLNLDVSKVSKSLPLLIDDHICPYDGVPLIRKLPSKSNQEVWNEDSICPKCGHIEFPSGHQAKCKCHGCVAKRLEEKNKLIGLIQSINNATPKQEYTNLSLENKLDLAVILQEFHAISLTNIGSFSDYSNLSDFNVDLLTLLEKKGIIKISTQSPLNAFDNISFDEGGVSYFPNLVTWDVWVQNTSLSDDQLLATLKNPNKGSLVNNEEITALYTKIALTELKKIFNLELNRLQFNVRYDNEKDIIADALTRWSAKFSPAEIYYLIYISVRRANDKRTAGEWGNY